MERCYHCAIGRVLSDIRDRERVLLMVLLGLGFYGTRMNKEEQE